MHCHGHICSSHCHTGGERSRRTTGNIDGDSGCGRTGRGHTLPLAQSRAHAQTSTHLCMWCFLAAALKMMSMLLKFYEMTVLICFFYFNTSTAFIISFRACSRVLANIIQIPIALFKTDNYILYILKKKFSF